MRQIFKVSIAGIIAVVVMDFMPLPAYAARNPQCEIYAAHRQRISQTMQSKENVLKEQRNKNQFSIPQEQTNTALKVTTIRKEDDKTRQDTYKKIQNKVTTKSQKDAVAAYQANVDAAISTYRTTLDAATSTFNTELSSLVNAHRAATDTALSTLKSRYDSHTVNTISYCDIQGKSKADELFKNSIREYEQQYSTAAFIVPRELEQKVHALQAIKRQSDLQAKNELKASLKKAKHELQKIVKPTTKYIYN